MIQQIITDTQPIITGIPNNTVKLTLIAKVFNEDEEFAEYTTTLSLPEIIEARISARYWEDENVTYELTEKGREYLENLMGELND